MKVIQVVKRFGLCGGMEEYVFRLSEHLADLGVNVKVLCEIQVTKTSKKLDVVQLGHCMKKPRWFSHILFSYKVSNWLKSNASTSEIIHSHERISCHHVTTIHSTLFNFHKEGFPSFRKLMNEFLEQRELSSPSVKKIVPVSGLIANEILTKFPFTKENISDPIPPGISEIPITKKKFSSNKPVLGFMGQEWKRKGLPKVIEIWREIRKEFPQSELCLAGFSKSEKVGLLDNEIKNVQILGYLENKSIFYSKIDLLLHPAKKEAYGMVIDEASSLGIPVLCSNECGIVNTKNTNNIFSLNESTSYLDWVKHTFEILKKCDLEFEIPFVHNTWRETSLKFIDVYNSINTEFLTCEKRK